MNKVRGLRDPQKRWVMHFDLQVSEWQVLPVCLYYEPALKEPLAQIFPLFNEHAPMDVSTWWEPVPDSDDVQITAVILQEGGAEAELTIAVVLPAREWEAACERSRANEREMVLLSLTANPAVLRLEDDPTSWEVEVPIQPSVVYRETRPLPDWRG